MHARLHEVARAFINILQEILSCGFQQQDLVVVVSVVAKIAAFFAHEFIVKAAVGYVRFVVIVAREGRA